MQISTDVCCKSAPYGIKATVVTDNSFMLNVNINIIVFFSLIFHRCYGPISGLLKFMLLQHFFSVFPYLVERVLRGARNKSLGSFTSSVDSESSIYTGAQYF